MHKERVFLPDIKARRLLLKYATGNQQKGNLTKQEYVEMLQLLSVHCQPLRDVIVEHDHDTFTAPLAFRQLYQCLASPSPVCATMAHTDEMGSLLEDLCDDVNIRNDPVKWQLLQEASPVIFEMLTCDTGLLPLSSSFKSLLRTVYEKAQVPFRTEETIYTKPKEAVTDEELLACFPSLPQLRNRGVFEADLQSKQKNQKCKKDFKGHPSLLPGIFTVFCEHGVCYGYQLMVSHESPNIPFTIFRTRFEKAPRTIVYDFSCSLHAYCLNRDPMFFSDTRFLVDRFHWWNHKGCSKGYQLDKYPSLQYLNSQVTEQVNAGLQRIKDQVSYMTDVNFKNHCLLYLYNHNIKVNACTDSETI